MWPWTLFRSPLLSNTAFLLNTELESDLPSTVHVSRNFLRTIRGFQVPVDNPLAMYVRESTNDVFDNAENRQQRIRLEVAGELNKREFESVNPFLKGPRTIFHVNVVIRRVAWQPRVSHHLNEIFAFGNFA